MALITGSANASIDPVTAQFNFVLSQDAGENLKRCAFVFIASDGDIEESDIVTGSSTIGVVARQTNSGEIADIFGEGTRIGRYSSGMTPGTVLYLSGTDPGSLDDAASAADQKGVAIVLTATDILVTRADGQQRGQGF